jgi:hypothetical protein
MNTNDTRYGHGKTSAGGGNQDQPERKDEGWESRQGGGQAQERGRGDDADARAPRDDADRTQPPPGTNTQGELAGIGAASDRVAAELQGRSQAGGDDVPHDDPGAGTDQPPRMGGPLGDDRRNPHLPEGDQDNETQGTGARGYDQGVNAQVVGAVHQGVKVESPDAARDDDAAR